MMRPAEMMRRFNALIEDGRIHPGMKRNEASALWGFSDALASLHRWLSPAFVARREPASVFVGDAPGHQLVGQFRVLGV